MKDKFIWGEIWGRIKILEAKTCIISISYPNFNLNLALWIFNWISAPPLMKSLSGKDRDFLSEYKPLGHTAPHHCWVIGKLLGFKV